MKVGVIGTHWGRVHDAFRASGHEVSVLMGQNLVETERIAREEGIPKATTDPADLQDVDVVVIASPTATHRPLIERFWSRPVLCEKPLCGHVPDAAFLDRLAASRVYVNYAFSFLDTARIARRHIESGSLGSVFRILANVSFRLPQERSDVEWYMDLASHPVSFLNLLFGRFSLVHAHSGKGRTNLTTTWENGRQLLNVNLYEAPADSILYDLTFVGDRAEMHLQGAYYPGGSLNFEPLLINGARQNEGERSQNEDVWIRANVRSVRAFLDVVEGRATPEQALAAGLCDGARAAWMELGLAPLLH